MEDDHDKDIHEESSSKIVYKRKSPGSPGSTRKGVHKSRSSMFQPGAKTERGGAYTRNEGFRVTGEQQRSRTGVFGRGGQAKERSKKTGDTRTGARRDSRSMTGRLVYESWSDTDFQTTDKVEEQMKDWSERARRQGGEKSRELLRGRKSRDGTPYFTVTKWQVDYTNKNYVRSKCHKNQGLHREVHGRPFNWDVVYDNNYYLRSKVNPPKGLHRYGTEMKRKDVPDDDILADSTGWEFEYGPEFQQVDEDVPYHRRERIVGRGGYRYYGVRRNGSDTDRKLLETRDEIREFLEDEYKYGAEFLQDDIPHLVVEAFDRKIDRGGYRFPDADRNRCDVHPSVLKRADSRTTKISSRTEVEKEETIKKGKPFKRTILKKTFRLIKPPSDENFNYGTTLTFVPREGKRSFYAGTSTTRPTKKDTSSRTLFKSHSKSNYDKGIARRSSILRSDSDEGEMTYTQKAHISIPERYSSEENVGQRSKGRRQSFDEYREQEFERGSRRSFNNELELREGKVWRGESGVFESGTRERHRFPPDVQRRINEIKNNVSREDLAGRKMTDWRSHEAHPNDFGKSVAEGYEKFTNERGSEIWIKTENKYSEFHHRAKK